MAKRARREIRHSQWCVKCGRVTTGRKSLCNRHMEDSPYIQDLKHRLTAYEALCVAETITPGSLVAHELLYALIEHGYISYKVLRKDNSRIRSSLFDLYISYFVGEGLCIVKRSEKKRMVKMIHMTLLTLEMYGSN